MSVQEKFLMISRSFLDSALFTKPGQNKSMCNSEAFMSLFGLVRWKSAPLCVKNAKIYQYELISSLSFLAVRFGWTKGKTQRTMDWWLREGYVSRRFENGNTIIKVEKFLILKGFDTAIDTISDTSKNEPETGVKINNDDTVSDTTIDTASIQHRYSGDTNKKKEKKEEKEKNNTKNKKKDFLLCVAQSILDKFNSLTGSKYRSKVALKHIKARLSEGFNEDECLLVIEYKIWENKQYDGFPNHENRVGFPSEHLNPTTLFQPSTFEKYLMTASRRQTS
jgi:uncharacterized phage protein (TIGR02220 family)|tara:strand:- start:285 stop:1121 length:837 start_codon:yes stop_codon:yes gene_type:complete